MRFWELALTPDERGEILTRALVQLRQKIEELTRNEWHLIAKSLDDWTLNQYDGEAIGRYEFWQTERGKEIKRVGMKIRITWEVEELPPLPDASTWKI
ncbi:MAG: hypothetical protein ACTSSA_12090 [Candidatus Freyarchaeota archaeon]